MTFFQVGLLLWDSLTLNTDIHNLFNQKGVVQQAKYCTNIFIPRADETLERYIQNVVIESIRQELFAVQYIKIVTASEF